MRIHQWERVVLQKITDVDKLDFPQDSKIAMKYAISGSYFMIKALLEGIEKNKINGMADLKIITDQQMTALEENLV